MAWRGYTIVSSIRESALKISAECSGTSTLTYRLGIDEASVLHWQVFANSGNGYFSTEWVPFQDIQKALTDWAESYPVTSMSLTALFQGRSVNTSAFLLAALVKEAILEPVPDSKRHWQLADTKAFLAEVEKLMSAHSKTVKAKPKAKAKAAARMPRDKSPAATSK